MKLLVVLSLFVLASAVSAKWAPDLSSISELENEVSAIGMKDTEEEPVVAKRSLPIIQKIKNLWKNATRALSAKLHSKGWFGKLNCATTDGTEMKGCNTFYGPLKCGQAYKKAIEVSDLVSEPTLNAMYHDRHGEYPHFHVAGHECVWAKVDCWGDGKEKLQWVNPHFWVHHNDVNNCPQESYPRNRRSG